MPGGTMEGRAMRVFPVLKPAHWQGLAHGARAHIWLGTPDAPEIIVAYGCYDGGLVSYVTNETSGYGEPEALVKEAFDNLKDRAIELQVVGTGADRVVIAAGPMAAEQVLSERHMLAAHDRLETDSIVVSITRRDAFMACAAAASDQLRRTMTGLHMESWTGQSRSTERLYDQLVVFDKGLKVDTIAVGENSSGHPRWGHWSAG
jgi:hypothetical protein